MSSAPGYVLGSDDAEVARLDLQAGAIAPPTGLLLQAAGVGPGMRVLDLGTGLGHVAFAVADMVGPGGTVVGIDQSATLLGIAEARRRAAGVQHVRFEEGDARTFRADASFDAVVMRLLLFHLPDAVDVLRHHLQALHPGGVMLAIDSDMGAARADPPVALVTTVLDWVERAFRSAGANPRVGAHLAPMLAEAGVEAVTTLGIQGYFGPDDPRGAALLAGVARSVVPQIVGKGIAGEDDVGVDTLEARVAEAIAEARSVSVPPAVVGAWGRRPA
jgi:SAM-dependent methyltransferase